MKVIIIIFLVIFIIIHLASLMFTSLGILFLVSKAKANQLISKTVSLTKNHKNVSMSYGVAVIGKKVHRIIAIFLAGFGGFTALVTLLAIVGAIARKRCLISVSASLQTLIILAIIGLGIYLYVKRHAIDVDETHLRPLVEASLDNAEAKYDNDVVSKRFLDAVMDQFSCYSADDCFKPYYKYVVSVVGVTQILRGKSSPGGVLIGFFVFLLGLWLLTIVLSLCMRRMSSDVDASGSFGETNAEDNEPTQ